MTANTEAFDRWIRSSFVDMNTELEELYFASDNRTRVAGHGDETKQTLLREGGEFVGALLEEGNTDEGFDSGFDLLGNVGLYAAACNRHEIAEPDGALPSRLKQATGLALHLGASLGLVPRFATSHLTTHNRALGGDYKTFTRLEDERIFIDFNARAIFAFKRAADALERILPLGVSHPVSYDLFIVARDALSDVLRYNERLFESLDADRFFYCVRPYYKTYRVGIHTYRGANGGDFSGINEIDLLLGLCHAEHPSYSQLLVEKFLYMRPEDQASLRDCMRRRNLLARFLDVIDAGNPGRWFNDNLAVFLEVCELHGETATQHHNQLVKHFIEKPSADLDSSSLERVTASGPPLKAVLASLEKLRDLRNAAERDDIPSSYRELKKLRDYLGG